MNNSTPLVGDIWTRITEHPWGNGKAKIIELKEGWVCYALTINADDIIANQALEVEPVKNFIKKYRFVGRWWKFWVVINYRNYSKIKK